MMILIKSDKITNNNNDNTDKDFKLKSLWTSVYLCVTNIKNCHNLSRAAGENTEKTRSYTENKPIFVTIN
jgi:hypothetical protein